MGLQTADLHFHNDTSCAVTNAYAALTRRVGLGGGGLLLLLGLLLLHLVLFTGLTEQT